MNTNSSSNRLMLPIVVGIISIFIIINNYLFSPSNILSWDVFGYYIYLPMLFIYNDVGMKDLGWVQSIVELYNSSSTLYQIIPGQEGLHYTKYTVGLSVLYLPFFFLGHLFAYISDYPMDGFSQPYQTAIWAGGIVYSILGIIVLSRVLRRFFSEKISAIVLLLVVFGTNYIVLNTMYGQNAMSHNYLFTAYAVILWFTIRFHETGRFKWLVFLSLACGLTILSRPTELVCILLPALWGIKNRQDLKERFQLVINKWREVLIVALILISIGSLQFLYWKYTTGHFFLNSYSNNPGEGFDFLRPHFHGILLSFRKGWFIYTPIMLLIIPGLYIMFREKKEMFWAVFIYTIANLYLVATWSCWWYAASFSQRALIPSYPVMAIILGYFLTWLSSRERLIQGALGLLILLLLTLNIFQTIQYHRGVLKTDRMTWEYYAASFLKMYGNPENDKLLIMERSSDASESLENEEGYNSRLLDIIARQDTSLNIGDSITVQGMLLDSMVRFSPSISESFRNLTEEDHVWVRIEANVFPLSDVTENPFSIVAHYNHSGKAYKYRAYDSEKMGIQPLKWSRVGFDYLSPEVRSTKDEFYVYVWLRGNDDLLVDSLKVTAFTKD